MAGNVNHGGACASYLQEPPPEGPLPAAYEGAIVQLHLNIAAVAIKMVPLPPPLCLLSPVPWQCASFLNVGFSFPLVASGEGRLKIVHTRL